MFSATDSETGNWRAVLCPALLYLLLGAAAATAGKPVAFTVHSTGENVNSGADPNYTIVSNTITETPSKTPVVVTSKPTQLPGWGTVPRAKWIAPDAVQDNSRNGCCNGIVKYRTTFNLKDPATGKDLDPNSVVLNLSVLADDGLQIYVNPDLGGDKASAVFSLGVFQNGAVDLRLTKNFVSGVNTLEFEVNNNGLGATGLSVFAAGTAEPPCFLPDGSACPPKLEVSNNFLVGAAVSGAAYSTAIPALLSVLNSGSGGPLPLSVGLTATAECPSSGGSIPFAVGYKSTSLQNDAAFSLRIFGSDPGGTNVQPGIYQRNLRITSGDLTQDICIVSKILPTSDTAFSLSKSGLLFQAQAGQGAAAQTLAVIGGGANWTAKVKTLPGDNFLSVATDTAAGKLTVTVAPEASPGRHYGVVEVKRAGDTAGVTAMVVVYNVTAEPPPLGLSTAGMVAVVSPDSAAASQTLSVIPSNSGSQAFTASTTTPFLSLPAPSGNAAGSAATPIQVDIDATKLALGINRGSIRLTSNGIEQLIEASVIYLPAGAKLSAAAGDSAGKAAAEGGREATTGCTPSQILVTGTSLPGNFSVLTGWPAVYQARVIDECGNPVVNATVTLSFSNGEQSLQTAMEDAVTGTYAVTWTPAIAGDVTITVRAAAGTSVSNSAFASTTTSGTITANPNNVPVLFRRGTVNNLYPVAGAPLAPGTIASIYGANLMGTGAASGTPLPTLVNGATATVGGIDAPIYFDGSGQINLEIPVELPAFGTWPVIVTVNGVASEPESITISEASPGVAAFGDGRLIAQHLNYQLVDAEHPAVQGETLIMYLDGLGLTNPLVGTNTPAPAAEPLARPVKPATVTVDSEPAELPYVGLTPNAVGLYQIDFTVPKSTNPGNAQIVVKQNNTAANTTTLPVVAAP